MKTLTPRAIDGTFQSWSTVSAIKEAKAAKAGFALGEAAGVSSLLVTIGLIALGGLAIFLIAWMFLDIKADLENS